jgi:hypothetical protein
MIAGYGASAKGNTFLNASLTKLDFIVDDNPLKQNMWTPGTTIPIYGQEVLEKYSDVTKICFVPLAWNFFEEIKEKIRTKRRNNLCVFLQYFPEVRLDGSVEETGV